MGRQNFMFTEANRIPLPMRRASLLGGREIDLWEDGSFCIVIRGGDGDDDDPPENDNKDRKEPLSSEEVQRIAAREKREGKTAGRRALAKELGFDDEDGLKQALADYQAAQDAAKSELEKERDQVAKDRDKVSQESAAAKRERFDARCERALLRTGCPDKTVEKVARLLDLDQSDDLEFEDFLEAAKKLKEEMPQLFAEGEEGNPDSDPGKSPKPKGGEKSAKEQAAEIFARNHPKPVSTGP